MSISVRNYLNLLRNYLQPQQQRVWLLAFLLLSSIGLQLLSPQVIRYFIDAVQSNNSTQRLLLGAALLFLFIVLLQRAITVLTTYVSQTVAWTATNALRRDLTAHVLRLDMAFHNAHTPGELLERIDGDVDRLANFFSEFVLQILGSVLLTIGVLLVLFWEDWRVGIVLTIFVVAYMLIHGWDQQWAAPEWRKEREYTAELSGFVEERVSGIREIQTSGAIDHTLARFYKLLQRRQWQALRADVITDLGWALSKIFYGLGTVAGLGMGAYLFQQGLISLGVVYLIVHYLTMLNEPLNRIARQLEDLQRVRVAIERVQQLTSTAPALVEKPNAIMLPISQALGVRFANVSFQYRVDKPVLCDLSFELAPGEKLGLLGRTGSGKTTLARLLFRLYDPNTGQIQLNGEDLRNIELANVRNRVGMVTQEVQLFGATVRDNLTLFDPTIADDAILSSLAQLSLEPWLCKLPNGLDTVLTANGAGLSAGEGQLLALARLFLKDPGLVILDEASSRLDPATEALLEQALDNILAERTGIIIAHRLATVRRADKILILENGTFKEFGSYQTLANNPNSVFAGLLQTGLEEVLV